MSFNLPGTPRESAKIAYTTSSAATALPATVTNTIGGVGYPNPGQVILQNIGNSTAYYNYGNASVTAAVAGSTFANTGHPIQAGASFTQTPPANATHIALIGEAAGTMLITVQQGD